MKQIEMSIPDVPADDIIREQIKRLERQINDAGNQGDDTTAQALLRERTRLQKIIRAGMDASACEHPNTELRYRKINGGSTALYHQCTDCGASVGSAVTRRDKSAEFLASLAQWDEQLQARAETARQMRVVKLNVEQDARTSEWWVWYNNYLESDAWKSRRRLVLTRDNHVCQGCRTDPATEVHHLTYDHVGFELLFELTSLCKACHDICHGPKGNQRPS